MIRLRCNGASPDEGALLPSLVNVSPKLPGTVKQERWKSRRRHFWWLIEINGFVRAPHTTLTHLLCNFTQQNGRPSHQIWLGSPFIHPHVVPFPQLRTSTMLSGPQQGKGRSVALAALDNIIHVLYIAKDSCGVPPAQIAFGSAHALLTTIRDTMGNRNDYVDLGLSCAQVCEALNRGLQETESELSRTVVDAIERMKGTMDNVQKKIVEKNNRNVFSRAFHARSDKVEVVAWEQEFRRILQIFNTELQIDMIVDMAGMRQDLRAVRRATVDQQRPGHARSPTMDTVGSTVERDHSITVEELLPPAPKAFFGRGRLIEDIVGRAGRLQSIALIGAGGIGKTSIALTVLHDQRIKNRFGENRRFIRCDGFPASRANFLAQLSRAVGSGIENPDNLASLRPSLTPKEMIIFLDNIESILDPQGTDAQDIYALVMELSNFRNVCLGITSRISTVPPQCRRLEIPALSPEAACDIFYDIYNNGGPSYIINDLVKRLDFHALSITLLATTASHNAWDYDRLVEEWNSKRAQLLRTDYDQSLATTIELSLTSPSFLKLGPNAREVLSVVAFFPQGIDKNSAEWLFPSIPDVKSTFDKFCTLSLTHRSNDFITMLAPIRDHLAPREPTSSPLLCTIKDRYFDRLSVDVYPDRPGFKEARWIMSEDVNVEHLLDTFTSTHRNADDVWDASGRFIEHLNWHKPRPTVLTSKLEGLPDNHRSKPKCLLELSELFGSIGNHPERKRLLTHTFRIERARDNLPQVAESLIRLSDVNRRLQLYKEGIQKAKEGLKLYEQLGDAIGQAKALNDLALLLFHDKQLDAAESAVFRALALVPNDGQEFLVCRSHRCLGLIYQFKGKKEEAISHFETTIAIASPFDWHDQLFWSHLALARLHSNDNKFRNANTHIKKAKSHTDNNAYNLGRAMDVQARIWCRQHKLGAAKSEALRALEIFEKLGAGKDAKLCKNLLQILDAPQRDASQSVSREHGTPSRNAASTPRVPYGGSELIIFS